MSSKLEKKSPTLDSVDQIRNILFGEQITIIEKRFSELEKNLTNSIDKLSEKVDKSHSNLRVQVEKSNEQLSIDAISLADQQAKELKSLESSINSKIVETESDLLNQIQSGLQQLNNKASHRNELAELLKEMAGKLSD